MRGKIFDSITNWMKITLTLSLSPERQSTKVKNASKQSSIHKLVEQERRYPNTR
jgi:hypothetical protein